MAAAGYYTWVAGEEPTAAQVNSRIRDQLVAICTTAQRVAIASPSAGLAVWDTDLNRLYRYVGGNWVVAPAAWVSAAAGAPSNKLAGTLLYETDTDVTKLWDGSAYQVVGSALLSGSTAGVSLNPSATNYIGVAGVVATEVNQQFAMPYACTVSKLYVSLDVVTGAATTWTVTVRKNAADTAVTCALTNVRAGSDTTHSVAFAAGDLCAIKAVPTSTPGGAYLNWSFRVKPA